MTQRMPIILFELLTKTKNQKPKENVNLSFTCSKKIIYPNNVFLLILFSYTRITEE